MKKNVVGSTVKAAANKKTRQKSKHKSKEKRFNVNQYLDSVMVGMHEHSQQTVRKRKSSAAKRDISSALAHTTPHSERTASSSKIRCKSSYSQYRKKSATIRQGLHLNLDEIVTQEDVINFTEVTARGKEEHSTSSPLKLLPMSQTAAARKIQRAWRNYLTRKVVSKYFEAYCLRLKKEKEERELRIRRTACQGETVKKDTSRTLKIRKQNQKTSPLTATKMPKPLFRTIDFQDQVRRLVSSQNQTKTIQYQQSGEFNDKEMPSSTQLKSIIQMFRSSHETASKQIEEHFNNFYKANNNLSIESEEGEKMEDQGSSIFNQSKRSFSGLQGLSPSVFYEMQNVIKQKFALLQNRLQDKVKLKLINSQQRLKAFQQLQGRMLREIRILNHCKQQYIKSIQHLKQEMIKMQNDNALVAKLEGTISYRVRRSYSAETLLMKQILQQSANKNIDLDRPYLPDQSQLLLQYNFRKKKEQRIGLSFPTSPPSVIGGSNQKLGNSGQSLVCYELDSEIKLREEMRNEDYSNIQILSPQNNLELHDFAQEDEEDQLHQGLQKGILKCDSIESLNISLPENSFRQEQNSRLVRQCSQQIEEKIQASLIQELVQQIYLGQNFWKSFRPYIQKPFEFKAISDDQIRTFLQAELPNFFPPQPELCERINQKINPTTLQILKLIRDVQFQIDQYELVLPQEVFKRYRKHVQQIYSHKLIEQMQLQFQSQTLPAHLKNLANQRCLQKKEKMHRFIKFQRDLKIMYMKSVFNSFNEIIIESKSNRTFMNGRSSIGPGELTLAIKEYNWNCEKGKANEFTEEARQKVLRIISNKCSLPQFKTHRDLQIFRDQFNKQLVTQFEQNEYKWVNYMDQVMQIWQDMSQNIIQSLFQEAIHEMASLF